MKYIFLKKGTTIESLLTSIFGEAILFFPDNWDDYGHSTSFYASYYNSSTQKDPQLLGQVKIASVYDKKGHSFVLRGEGSNKLGNFKNTYAYIERTNKLNTPLSEIENEFFFLGDEDFYHELHSFVGGEKFYINVLKQLGDLALDKSKFRLSQLQNEIVISGSFFRDGSQDEIEYLRDIILNIDSEIPFSWTIYVADNHNAPVASLDLTNNTESLLPSNIFALVGNNGIGKTSLLKDIVRLATNPDDEVDSSFLHGGSLKMTKNIKDYTFRSMSEASRMNVITRTLFITFSSFDNFDQEFIDFLMENSNAKFLGNRSYEDNGDKESNYESINSLVNPQELMDNVATPLLGILRSESKKARLVHALEEFKWDKDISNIKDVIQNFDIMISIKQNKSLKLPTELTNFFAKGSSGQKIILSMLIQIVSTAVDRSLIVIDEPELYLHVPYVLSLVLAIEDVLRATNSIGIVATHSAVVLQEIPARNINTIKELNGSKVFGHPAIETFGASTSLINNELFNLDIRATGYYKILAKIVEDSSLEKIDELIENNEYGDAATMILSALRGRKNVQ